MKKIISYLLVMALCLGFTGCQGPVPQASEDKLTIVAALFPEYDWLRNLTAGSDGVELRLLIDKGVDLHSYQPDVGDLVAISSCDVFVYTGGPSDSWVKDALETAMNEDLVVVDLMELMEQERTLCPVGDHDHEAEEEDHRHSVDEHIWLSLANGEYLCGELTRYLQELDPDNSQRYTQNLLDYAQKLRELDGRYRDMVAAAEHQAVLFGDRFPFAYLLEDYGLEHYAAYEGCSAETEVGFDTFIHLAEELNRLGLEEVVVIDDSDLRIAQTVIAAAGDPSREICTMQTMQAVNRKQIQAGVTYLSVMEENLAVLQQVLN